MKILSITAHNCRVHAETHVTFPTEGIIGITGSNEAGKSTLLEVLAWLLYGAKAIRGTMKTFRWKRAPETRKAGAMARIEIRGTVYIVSRSEKDAKVTIADGPVVAEGQDGVTGFMTDLLGTSYEEFMVGRVCQQKEIERIALMKPAERKGFVRRLMGVGRLDDGLDALRKRKNALSAERDGMAAGLGERDPLQDAHLRAATQTRTAAATLERMQADVHVTSAALTEASTQLAVSETLRVRDEGLRKELVAVEKDLHAAGMAVQSTTGKIATAKAAEGRVAAAAQDLARLPALREERDALRDARASADERKGLENRAAGLLNEQAGALGVDERMADAQAQIDAFRPEDLTKANERAGVADKKFTEILDARQARRTQAAAERDAISRRISKIEEQFARVESLGAAGACPTCTRVLGDALGDVLRTLENEADALRPQASDWDVQWHEAGEPSDEEIEAGIERDEAEKDLGRLLQLQSDAEIARRQIVSLQDRNDAIMKERADIQSRLAELPAVTFDADRLRAIEGDVRELEVKDAGLTKDRGLAAQLADLHLDRIAAAKQEEAATARIGELNASLRETPFSASGHLALKGTADRAERAFQDAQVAVARAEEVQRGAQAALAQAERALAEYDAKAGALKALDVTLSLYRRADTMLDQFRTAYVQRIKPEMEEIVTGLVNILTDGRHEAVTLTDDFQCTLYHSGVAHEVVSGGTENIAALAMRLAISQMIAQRSGGAGDLLILDEPFDGFDDTRRQNVLALIRRLGGFYRQVIVISNVPDTREAVDHVVELEYDTAAGCSRVVSQPQLEAVA